MQLKILDAKPQVGIFEIVDGVFLKDTEDVQMFSVAGDFFDGEGYHLHSQDIQRLVLESQYINDDIKKEFRQNKNAYLKYPRGRVDYNTKTKKYHIMAAKDVFTVKTVEKITREFNLPPYASGNIVLEADEGHYGY